MRAEKYVKDIVGRIKCSGTKKKEIQTQLLSDISMRMQQGEQLEEVIESMGSAQEIADAFSQNLPETERKAYRRKKAGIVIAAVLIGIILLGSYVWWVFPKPYSIEDKEMLSEEAVAGAVETVIRLLNADDFETLKEMSVDEMQSALTPEIIDKARNSISDDWGEMCIIGSTYAQGLEQKGRVFVITQTNVMYENVSVVYTITFDENLQLAGVYMK